MVFLRLVNQRFQMSKTIREIVKEKILILDGAMGTEIQKYNLTEDDFRGERFRDVPGMMKGNNDMLNITRPDDYRQHLLLATYFASRLSPGGGCQGDGLRGCSLGTYPSRQIFYRGQTSFCGRYGRSYQQDLFDEPRREQSCCT